MRRALIAIGLLAASAPAFGQTAWGIWNNGPGSQTIITFNVNTPGVFNTIGPTGVLSTAFANSLDFGPGGTNLYMATNAATGFLHDISQVNGAASNPRGSGLVAGDGLGDMSYDHFAGRMLGIGTSGVAGGGARLYSINLASGVATNLGTVGGLTEGFSVSLAVRPSDGLIFAHGIETDRWYTINPGTLAATPLTSVLGVDTNFGQGATFHPGSSTLYHALLSTTGGNQNRLATIDQVTGLPTFIGTLGGPTLTQVGDIAFPIPTPASSLLLVAASGLMLRRRR
jgi:hypothetical protein